MIYLDNSATTRMDEDVLGAMLPWMRDSYGNASSIHSLGRAARVAVENARTEIASLMNAHPAELIFTSGGTEADNTVLKSMNAESALVRRIVVGATEHHAVLHPAEEMAAHGTDVDIIGVDPDGRVRPDEIARYDQASCLVSIMHANNETGVVQPIAALRERIPSAYIHTDAVQSFGKISVDVKALGVDFATISAHKIHGPKGIGALFIRKGIDFKAHQQGGAQERNRRAGTEAVALIVGFQVAARKAHADMEVRTAHMTSCTTLLRDLLVRTIPDIRFNTPESDVLPHILNVSFLDAEQLDGEAILQAMDIAGVAVSNGSACVSGSQQPSHVLSAMGLSAAEARAAIRFSVSKDTTHDEIHGAVAILAEIVRNMRV